jgi:hypothetical protein
VAEPPHRWWSATPRLAVLRVAKPPPVAQGVVRLPLGPNAQKRNFERLAQGAAKPPPEPLGVVRLPPNQPVWGGGTTTSGPGGGSAALWAKCLNFCLGVVWPPSEGQPGGGRTTPGQTGWPATTYGVVRPPQHIFIYIYIFFLFLEKKCAGGILGINRPNGLNCHNLKVWGG